LTLELNRIYCGDCLDLMKEIPDKSIDLVLTDPPYGIKENNERNLSRGGLAKPRDYGHFDWDNKPPKKEVFNEIFRVSQNQIIFGGNYFSLPPTSCYIVWDKKNFGTDFADCELAWGSFNSAVRIFRYRWLGFLREDMTHKEERVHPTQKPVKLMEWCLLKYSQPGDTVLDPFLGSGTTAVACKRTGRNFIGIEKEQKYVEIALKRLEKVNNRKLSEFLPIDEVTA
jgi:site-specific DNA-methyltransferase (adenine-specific)